jgi:5'-nucleotidase
MNTLKPLILVNDGGSRTPALIAVMAEIGDVFSSRSRQTQSGMGHAITTNSTLYLNKI